MERNKKNWRQIRSQVKEFVENEVYPAESLLSKRDETARKKIQELMQLA
ncbi:uncharacterized protein METZ01_LOCUS236659, partial [marine metagenome]